jgi:hypothetical protein
MSIGRRDSRMYPGSPPAQRSPAAGSDRLTESETFPLTPGIISRYLGRAAGGSWPSRSHFLYCQPLQHMTHSLEYDAIHKRSIVHALTAPLAAVEARGHVSGREFITAVARAVDLTCRIGLAT